MKWATAVKEWNSIQFFKDDMYGIPRKGGEYYDDVKAIMEGSKHKKNVEAMLGKTPEPPKVPEPSKVEPPKPKPLVLTKELQRILSAYSEAKILNQRYEFDPKQYWLAGSKEKMGEAYDEFLFYAQKNNIPTAGLKDVFMESLQEYRRRKQEETEEWQRKREAKKAEPKPEPKPELSRFDVVKVRAKRPKPEPKPEPPKPEPPKPEEPKSTEDWRKRRGYSDDRTARGVMQNVLSQITRIPFPAKPEEGFAWLRSKYGEDYDEIVKKVKNYNRDDFKTDKQRKEYFRVNVKNIKDFLDDLAYADPVVYDMITFNVGRKAGSIRRTQTEFKKFIE